MTLLYKSTRNSQETVTASQAILKGIANDGGLYIPTTIPSLPISLDELANLSYQELAFLIMKQFFTDFTDEELRDCINQAYHTSKFDTDKIAPLHTAGTRHYLELFHGETIAFKDMALSILPYLMRVSAQKNNIDKDIVILTATSGDTGKAAMAGFADVPGTKIIVFYPKGGVSHIQELQMLTQKGDNTYVVGITSNFDDAQSKVKELFTSDQLKQQIGEAGYQFSSANSINIGRLIPQVVYYVYAYAQLIKTNVLQAGQPMNVSVPTGNFGNILAAYYAKQMGLPIKTLICASNKNNVLTDFFKNGVYDKNRPFFVTNSPSMDILISSNLERLLYHISSDTKTATFMAQLAKTGKYELDNALQHELADFYAACASETDVLNQIKSTFDKTQYVLDPHTAVADYAYSCYVADTNDTTPTVIASTASPYKFPRSVMAAIAPTEQVQDDLVLVDQLEALSHIQQPQAVLDVKQANIRHHEVIDVADMQQSVLNKLL